MNFGDRKPEFSTIFLHENLSIIVAVKVIQKREKKTETGRIYCDFLYSTPFWIISQG